ncbi:MAG: hypothetical protein MP439_07125 [Ferrimicrobium sp.]|jgi:hypothetical protein|nr:hypothetical protein [Ferrimicrobium sp.]
MRRRHMFGTVTLGAALLAACGSTSTQSSKPAAKVKASPGSEYLNIYKGIPNSPVTSNGYPFSVPDTMRILAPKVLAKEVRDTKLAKIGDTYVGTTWTPTQRMEIYTAKLYATYRYTFGIDQYLDTSGTNGRTNKSILPDIARVFAPFYGSLAAADRQMVTSTSDGIAIVRNDTPQNVETGMDTIAPAFLGATNLAFFSFQGIIPAVKVNLPAGSYKVTINTSPAQVEGNTASRFEVGFNPQPHDWGHVWPVVAMVPTTEQLN